VAFRASRVPIGNAPRSLERRAAFRRCRPGRAGAGLELHGGYLHSGSTARSGRTERNDCLRVSDIGGDLGRTGRGAPKGPLS
jgi:hypothetical protein